MKSVKNQGKRKKLKLHPTDAKVDNNNDISQSPEAKHIKTEDVMI